MATNRQSLADVIAQPEDLLAEVKELWPRDPLAMCDMYTTYWLRKKQPDMVDLADKMLQEELNQWRWNVLIKNANKTTTEAANRVYPY